ncbi:MAG: hypothetical protein A3C06_01965 [Candidatus Taylorbacteria bacterium RIFCSPHIGHO2_02_FULL_46_13]|uniref:Large ribosomal subunit protein uL15 n=1 Tax=Candidatus Taylorbacteria bacterium RIFCSPHIGHO2_02_FULL_46_13 TaxID=1802312 RepID=A0A1G2MPZ7_9BACT|nr:MAG: hypothetical protein A3C06_01965 [Candidatus Taylorbacteria bacterium RIFCSPHIGHO2_02_FULL_46_13]
MQMHNIQRNTKRKYSQSVGRGGKRGKTSGRGTKGQKARSGRKIRPEIRDVIMRLPKLRGRGKNINQSIQADAVIVDIELLEKRFEATEVVTPQTLLEKGLIESVSGVLPKVKILGSGELTKKLSIVGCSVSAGAKTKIEKVGGKITA